MQWAHSTPTMLLMMSVMSDLSAGDVALAVLADMVMVVSGLLATWSPMRPLGLGAAAASFASFWPVLHYLYRMLFRWVAW